MLVIQPICLGDLDQLFTLASQPTFGLTTLPGDKELLRDRILESIHSFERRAKKPRGEAYLFVLKDLESGKVVGTCGVVSKVGGFEPFYTYRIEKTVLESKVLKVRKEVKALHLVQEHSGPSEIGSLFLLPECRAGGHGRLLSLSRFLFMAEFHERFEPHVIAEMRGVIDDSGRSPFWEALGRHFFDVDFHHADYMSMKDKRFIAELMPTHPIYIDLLPKEAQEVIGMVHPETRPALRMLQEEGFKFCGMVDIFEAGPVIHTRLSQIRTVRENRRETVAAVDLEATEAETFILANTSLDFRACLGPVSFVSGGGVRIPCAVARALQVEVGDAVRVATLRASCRR